MSSCGLASTPSMLLVYRESPALTDTPSLSNTCPGVLPGQGVSSNTTTLSLVTEHVLGVDPGPGLHQLGQGAGVQPGRGVVEGGAALPVLDVQVTLPTPGTSVIMMKTRW